MGFGIALLIGAAVALWYATGLGKAYASGADAAHCAGDAASLLRLYLRRSSRVWGACAVWCLLSELFFFGFVGRVDPTGQPPQVMIIVFVLGATVPVVFYIVGIRTALFYVDERCIEDLGLQYRLIHSYAGPWGSRSALVRRHLPTSAVRRPLRLLVLFTSAGLLVFVVGLLLAGQTKMVPAVVVGVLLASALFFLAFRLMERG